MIRAKNPEHDPEKPVVQSPKATENLIPSQAEMIKASKNLKQALEANGAGSTVTPKKIYSFPNTVLAR